MTFTIETIEIGLIWALIAVLMSIVILTVRRMWPIHLDISYLPLSKTNADMGIKFDDQNGDTRHAEGKLGELVTAMLFANDGWHQLPSQTSGMHQADGIFIRRRGNKKSFEVAFVETKASFLGDPRNNYRRLMSVDELLGNLQKYEATDFDEVRKFMPEKTAKALKSALNRRCLFVNMYLYTHNFAAGECRVYRLHRDGRIAEHIRNQHDAARYKALLQALTISLGRLLKLSNKEIDATHAAMRCNTKVPTFVESHPI